MSVKICMIGIVKNESKIITRMLDSIKPVVDYIAITDTGSQDNTPEIIEKWLIENKVEGKVFHNPFVNFAISRTQSYINGKLACPDANYFLLTDADMILKVEKAFNKNNLKADAYLVKQVFTDLDSPTTRLINTKIGWRCLGASHEGWYPILNDNFKQEFLPSLFIDDRNDGCSKGDKFPRDKRLLSEEIAKPDTEEFIRIRDMFYLANTYYDCGEYFDAVNWYQKRISCKGYEEEVFMSYHRIGLSYKGIYFNIQKDVEAAKKSIKEKEKAIKNLRKIVPSTGSEDMKLQLQTLFKQKRDLLDQELMQLTQSISDKNIELDKYFSLACFYLLKAWEKSAVKNVYPPARAEPLYYLAELYRTVDDFNTAMIYINKGKEMPYPKNCNLFIEPSVYSWKFDWLLSITAYWIPDQRASGKAANKRLMDKLDKLPENIREQVVKNNDAYKKE